MDRPNIDRAVIAHIAGLAAITLTDDEATRMVRELGTILAYVEELAQVNTEDASGCSPSAMPWREDVVFPGLSHDDALRQAPQSNGEGFAVPTFVAAARPGVSSR